MIPRPFTPKFAAFLLAGQAVLYVTGYAVGTVVGWAWNRGERVFG